MNRKRSFGLLATLLLLVASGLFTSAGAQHPNGAGLVIRHGDGTLIYAYVQFEEEQISGSELLERAGLDVSIAPYGGLGYGVCSIGGEGCPADDCYCKSFQAPAYFWQYYTKVEDGWQLSLVGPSGRMLQDGDIDGWSWTAGDHGLPAITIDEIAAMNGVDRAASAATSVPPTSTPELIPTETPVPEPTTRATATGQPTSVAVIVTPGATPQAIEPATESGGGGNDLLLFGIVAGAIVTLGGAAAVYRRRSSA